MIDLVRIQVEILYPGCQIVGQHTIPMYISRLPRPFLSRPKILKWKLGKTMDSIVVQEQAARLHFQSIGTGVDLITLGDLDFLLTLKTEEELFGQWIEGFIELAVREGEEVEEHYKRWCKIGLFNVDVDMETIQFTGWLPDRDELQKMLSPGGSSF